MTAIDTARFRELLTEAEPRFGSVLGRVSSREESLSLGNAMAEVAEATIELIRGGNNERLVEVFRAAERGLVDGTSEVKAAVATQFLETLQHASDEATARVWTTLLGNESREYCRAWDDFTGVRTPGL